MPTKASQLIAFFSVVAISVTMHRYVYINLKRVLLRDYPRLGPRLVRAAMWIFVAMDTPFIFLFFRNHIHSELSLLTKILIYPFSIWQAIMILWAVILVPFTAWRRKDLLGFGWLRYRAEKWKSKKNNMRTGASEDPREERAERSLGIVTD